MFYSCLKWPILRGVLLSFSQLKKLSEVWGLLKRMKQQKLTMGEVNKWAIHTEPFIARPPALCLQIARFQPIYRDRGRGQAGPGGQQLGWELDWLGNRRGGGSLAGELCSACSSSHSSLSPRASLPHYSFLNTHIGGTLFTLDPIWDSYPNMNTLPWAQPAVLCSPHSTLM